MNSSNKKVHWSQYADEISFLTIQDTVPLSDSIDEDDEADDDYFSEESADFESLEFPDEVFRKKSRRNGSGQCQFFPMDEYSLLKSSISGKSSCNHVCNSNYCKEPEFFERRKSCHSKYPRSLKEDKCQERRSKMKEKWRNIDYEDDEDEMTYSNYSGDDKSTLSPRSCDDSSDTLGSPRKSQDNYWISPPISLSKRNSNASRGDCIKSGRVNSEPKCEDRVSRLSSTERRSYQNADEHHYRVSKVRPTSETRRSRLDNEEEGRTLARKLSKARYDCISEDMKPNLPQPRVKPNRSRSERPNKNRTVSRYSSKASKKSNPT